MKTEQEIRERLNKLQFDLDNTKREILQLMATINPLAEEIRFQRHKLILLTGSINNLKWVLGE